MPCPNGVSISDIFSLYNASAMFDRKAWSANWYKNMLLSAGEGADQCTECGECAPKCPQKIAICEVLKQAHAHLTST